jgi:aminoglycoside phosphotransferase (APT) family kinase protein
MLCEVGRVTAVIDWSDTRAGDPAIDLAWCLFRPVVIREPVAETYRISHELREQACFYHQLGPWYEVTYGLDTGSPVFVASGLDGIRDRLQNGC